MIQNDAICLPRRVEHVLVLARLNIDDVIRLYLPRCFQPVHTIHVDIEEHDAAFPSILCFSPL